MKKRSGFRKKIKRGYVGVVDITARYGIKEQTIRTHITRGDLKASQAKKGGVFHIKKEDADRFYGEAPIAIVSEAPVSDGVTECIALLKVIEENTRGDASIVPLLKVIEKNTRTEPSVTACFPTAEQIINHLMENTKLKKLTQVIGHDSLNATKADYIASLTLFLGAF